MQLFYQQNQFNQGDLWIISKQLSSTRCLIFKPRHHLSERFQQRVWKQAFIPMIVKIDLSSQHIE